MNELLSVKNVWLAIGFVGQIFFTMRFLVQWIYSEKKNNPLCRSPFGFLVF